MLMGQGGLINMTKSYKYGKVELPPRKEQKKKEEKEEKSLLDLALEEKDYALADKLLKKNTVKDFYLEAINNKLERLQSQIDKIDNLEIGHAIAKKIIKEYDKD